jgi:hypothetical protein
MMGMFPPDTTLGPQLSAQEVTSLDTTGLGLPPFKVRGAKEVNQAMGTVALPHGYRSIQSTSFENPTIDDDLDMTGCNYVNTVDGYTFPAESTYASVEWVKDDLRIPISVCFNLTQAETDNMSFMDLYSKCDII